MKAIGRWWFAAAGSSSLKAQVHSRVRAHRGWFPLRRRRRGKGLLRAGRRRVWPGFRDANEHYGNTYFIFIDKRKHRAGAQRQATTSKGSLQTKRTKEAGWRKMFLFSLSFTFTSHSGEKLPSLTGNKLDNSLAVHCSISILSRLIQSVFFPSLFWI